MAKQPNDFYYMGMALAEAKRAFAEDEVPVGAIVVCRGAVVGFGHNQREGLRDATAHAEMLALRMAMARLGGALPNVCGRPSTSADRPLGLCHCGSQKRCGR